MVDYVPPWDALPRDSVHTPHELPLSQVRKSAATFAALLDENKEEHVLKEACLGLCQLFGEGIQNDRIQAILEANVVPKLVSLLRPSKSRSVPISVQSAALQVLGNVACGDDRQTQVVIDSDALPCLRALLSSPERGIRKEVCWIVSNITESSHQVQDVLDADILPPLLKLLDSQDPACREDATWVLFNLSSNRDPVQIAYLAEKNGVRALCNLLNCSKELDVLWKGCRTVAAVALKGLRNILISGQIAAASEPNGYNKMASLVAEAHGVERIEALTAHVLLDVRTRARLLLERMFGAEPTTADLSPPMPPPTMGLSALSSSPPPPMMGHSGCACAYQHTHHHSHGTHYHAGLYDVASGLPAPHAGMGPSGHMSHGVGLEHGLGGHLHPDGDLVDVPGSTSGSSTDSDPEDDDSDSDLIPPPPAPCSCVLCTDDKPLAERRPRVKGSMDDSDFQKRSNSDDGRGVPGEVRQMCNFCSGGGRLGDGRAGLAAKLGRAVRLGHPHCIAVLLSRMVWGQRVAATEAPALLHPGGGPPDGGVGNSLPAVILAAQLGKPECLGLLLRRCRPDLDVTHGKKRLTALAWAAHKGYMRCCQLLIDHKASPATKCGEGVTALHLAASGGGRVAICKLLIAHKAPVNARSSKKQTPLCLAAQKGFAKVVQLLLDHGADPNNEDEGKYTPLHLSASNGFVSCVELLLSAGARVDATTRNGVTPLHYAVQSGHADVVKLLIGAGAEVNCNRKPLLLIAADDGNLEIVQILLDANATIDCKANIKAVLDKDIEVLDYLTPLHLASSKGHQDVVDLLLARGAVVYELTTKNGWSALDFAVLNGNARCAVLLLEYGALVTDQCKSIGRNNWTLVQYAAHHQAKDVVRMLIQRLKEQRLGTATVNGQHPSTWPDCGPVDEPIGAMSLPDPADVEEIGGGDYNSGAGLHSLEFANGEDREQEEYVCHHVDDHEGCAHHGDGVAHSHSSSHRYDPRSLEGDESGFGAGARNNSTHLEHFGTPTRRRVVKEDRQSAVRAREIKKREGEATDARVRLEEAIAMRSISKLTEAIAHVSKLVLHLAATVGGDASGSGGHVDHADMNGYGAHADSFGHVGHVHSPGGSHVKHSGGAGSSPVVTTPLAMEVGLGIEVRKARTILAGLLAEEKRMKEEREREVADTKREHTQQLVRKAITAALEGGDPRSLARVTNRATRTVLDKEDPVINEASSVSECISDLEKWEAFLKNATDDRNLDEIARVLPKVSEALTHLEEREGHGATIRVFGGSDPGIVVDSAAKLLRDLQLTREKELAKAEEAKNNEKCSQEGLAEAMKSDDIMKLETALGRANDALLSKDSELATTIEAAKKVMTKWLKGERRKLRQASNTNDPDSIEAAASVAESFGLQALQGDIEAAKLLAAKLRKQSEALQNLADATAVSDVSALNDIRSVLTSLGMFSEAEEARSEMERLQKGKRARTLLEGAIRDAESCQRPFVDALSGSTEASSNQVQLNASWTWPDAQRLRDLSERARKYGSSMQSLCNSADQLAKDLAARGRQVLALSTRSDDATAIAAVIAGYEKSFVSVSKPAFFDAAAGEKALREAREHLADVQALDQESIKAESAQVKVEYALATSRRSAVARNRGTKGSGAKGQAHQISNANTSASTNGNLGVDVDARCPSTGSSDLADEEITEVESSLSGMLGSEGSSGSKGSETLRYNFPKKMRGGSHVEESPAYDAYGDLPGAAGECSHFYLYKEGTTVCCARCGHLRNSGNPEWLARVKRRGSKVPADTGMRTLPSVGSAPDMQGSFSSLGGPLNGTGRVSPNRSGTSAADRGVGRSARPSVPFGHHTLSSQGFGLASASSVPNGPRATPSMNSRGNVHPDSASIMVHQLLHQQQQQHQRYHQQQYQQHHPQALSQLHSMAPQVTTGQHHMGVNHSQARMLHASKPGHQRGRARAHASTMGGVDQNGQALNGMFGVGVGRGREAVNGSGNAAGSIAVQANYAPASGIQALPSGLNPQQPRMHGYPAGASSGMRLVDAKSGLPIHGDLNGMRLDHTNMTHGSNVVNASTLMRAGGHRSGMMPDDSGVSGADLGTEFMNENFGFDIGQIVDDNPPLGPSKSLGSHSAHDQGAELSKMYEAPSRAQRNGVYRR